VDLTTIEPTSAAKSRKRSELQKTDKREARILSEQKQERESTVLRSKIQGGAAEVISRNVSRKARPLHLEN
jgi:hypothetical protein